MAPAVDKAAAPSLFDVLPGHNTACAGSPETVWQQRKYPLPAGLLAAISSGVGADQSRLASLTAAAMALIEAGLTGNHTVLAAIDCNGSRHCTSITIPAQGMVTAWLHSTVGQLRNADDEASGQPAWLVTVAQSQSDRSSVVELLRWEFTDAGNALLTAHFSPSLDGNAVDLLAACLLRVMQTLLEISAESEFPLDLLTPAERQLQLHDWNDTAVPRRREDCVASLFAECARAHPDNVAVVDGNRELSYQQLDRRANALAGRLRAAGVTTGSIVAIALPRSADAVVALLATLKAGAAYLPLDASYPIERLEFMLNDAAATLLVTDASGALSDVAPTLTRLQVDDVELESGPQFAGLDGEGLAYVMYTSGSTGTPKAVEIQHRSIIRLVRNVDYIRLDPSTRFLHAAPLGFDAATLELWGPLLNGGRVVVHAETLPTAEGLGAAIARHGVTTAWLTCALFNTVVEQDAGKLAGLNQLFFGGERASAAHVRRALDLLPTTELINGYGPTECTTFASTYAVPRDFNSDEGTVPIGRPISDTTLYVLNSRLQPVPVGVTGELFIGGIGLARGYRNQPELTARKFLDDPFHPGARLYRTGDLVRYRPDGNLEFVGRTDGQVKLRGFRIELGEIEARLGSHPKVASCAVLVREDRPGDKRLVAYYVSRATDHAARATPPELREFLLSSLPSFMVPVAFAELEALPVNVNGKLDRNALPAPVLDRSNLASAFEPAVGQAEQTLCELFADVLALDDVGRHDNFFELGGNSLLAIRLHARLPRTGANSVPATLVFQQPTPAKLACALAAMQAAGAGRLQSPAVAVVADSSPAQLPRSAPVPAPGTLRHEPVAIIAMAGRFPGAHDVEQFWQNLCAGRESITLFRPDEIDPAIPAAERRNADYVAARGILDDVEQFDAAFFGINPREAELMDPQHRIFLELSWECLERGGQVPDATCVPVGVFAGTYHSTYMQRHVSGYPELVERVGAFQVLLGNEKDFIATRVAHKLNLTGPAISVYTGCSTSLVAICQALDSLRVGRCDMALAGGVAITCPPRSGYLHQEGAMLSPDGHTRTFDALAAGTVFSDGAGVVLLKRLSDALRDGDPIHALILGGAVNNDGAAKASFTAPSSEGQANVIAMALSDAGVLPRSISYVEAHGTATPLGDPIEIEGLNKAFRQSTADTGFCRIGSVKSNIGHLVIAAGAAGVIKTAMAMAQRQIPASLHFSRINPTIELAGSPFVVNAEMTAWSGDGAPLRAGVSSFGVGGTNAHVVLQQAPERQPSEPATQASLLVLSARTAPALQKAVARLADFLQADLQVQPGDAASTPANLADVAWTLASGRKHFAHRAAVACSSNSDAIDRLRSPELAAAIRRGRPARHAKPVFMFPGQGAQYAGMGRALYEIEREFREPFDACIDGLRAELGYDLSALMFSDDPALLLPTSVMQPALFSLEYALACLWMSKGVQPAAMLGHSVGEFVAATLAGIFTLDDALLLVARRGALMQAQPSGAMLSVRLPASVLMTRLPAALSLAAENAIGSCVVSGPQDDIANFRQQLESEAVACRELHTSHAFHSAMMEPVVAPFRQLVASVTRRKPSRKLVSGTSGQWLDDDTAMSPDYWARHLREPVRFAAALATALADPAQLLLEVGPRATLCGLARQHSAAQLSRNIPIASLGADVADEVAAHREAAGQLWCHGVGVDPAAFDQRQRRQRLQLPTYPFERQRFWVEAAAAADSVSVLNYPDGPRPALSVVPLADEPTAENPVEIMPAIPTAAIADATLFDRLAQIFEECSGFEFGAEDRASNFIELGLDSLMLTQVALQLQKTFKVRIGFRQLMAECSTLDSLAAMLAASLPPPAASNAAPPGAATGAPIQAVPAVTVAAFSPAQSDLPVAAPFLQELIEQQMKLMQAQVALLQGITRPALAANATQAPPRPALTATPSLSTSSLATPSLPASAELSDATPMMDKYDVKKAFGAIARIDTSGQTALSQRQASKLQAYIKRYVARTTKSKEFTQQNRATLADPRVVNGFRPLLKEVIYQIVVERSKGAHLWDIDGNEYVDALNGFGMSLFGWQPDFVLDAVRRQLDAGYEIGPQHPLAGEVARLVCEVTGHERAALCNTGSEAVLGALRIARTVTGRNTIVIFTGSYHGIVDEMIVRAGKNLRAMPAAPGILRNTAENVLVLDYGTPEALEIIRSRADDIAAVLVEPVQSRRPDFQPRQFLHQLRSLTREIGALYVFDEVVTGFRSHPQGAQGLFEVKADLATYGKVVGGGFPIGVIAGASEFMDALDGGPWCFGDDSMPTVGVTYFAGTFVRHPLALAAAKAVLEHLRAQGPALQETLNSRTAAMAAELNSFCAQVGAPISVRQFSSVWKTQFLEEHPLQDLLFGMMRSRGVHILDNFPCFMTTAHSEADFQQVIQAFKDSVAELQDAEFLPRAMLSMGADADAPPLAEARLGREPDGSPGWFAGNPAQAGTYLRVESGSAPSQVDYDPFAGAPVQRVVPSTEPQREVWLADGLGTDASLAFNESIALRLHGPLEVDALQLALRELVQRHDALRSSFSPDGERLCVLERIAFDPVLTDLSQLDGQAREAAMQERLRAAVETPFSLAQGDLFRGEILRLGQDEHLLLLTAHHIVCDGWSWWVLVRELGALYAQHRGLGTADLAEGESFAAYALAQAGPALPTESVADESYWLARFADLPAAIELPSDRPRLPRRSFSSRRLDHVVDADLVAAVRRLGARRGASLFATLLAGFSTLVSRLTDTSTVVLGIPASGQAADGLKDLVGHCVNLLPLRIEVDGTQPFAQTIDAAQTALLDGLDHQRYTFGTLLKNLAITRDPARLPLISVMFNIDQALEQEADDFPGLSFDVQSIPRSFENFELFINAVQIHGALRLECQYNTDLFDAATIGRWLRAYECLLRAAVEHSAAPVRLLPLLDQAAANELAALQPEPVDFDLSLRMHELFEMQCDLTPDRIAVVFGEQAVSYSELEAQANRVANLLRKHGIQHGALVGLAMDREPAMLAALLGILKAGAGYVPLDPLFPAERLAYMTADAGLAALVTQRRHADRFDLRGRPILEIDRLASDLSAAGSVRPGRDVDGASPESVAYVIYTSGSTGRPKGVQVPHRAVANFLPALLRETALTMDDRLVAVTTLSFDIAVLELLLPLCVGAQVILASSETAADGDALMALVLASGASALQATPATFRLLIEAGWRGATGFKILCGGEAMPSDLAGQLLERSDAVWNLYGPTETTVWSTCAKLAKPEPGKAPDIHIGRPIANTRVWIMDGSCELLPVGVPGEICIGGDGVSLGYLRRPELTAEKFVPDQVGQPAQRASASAASMLYRTGDRGRWRADGQLEHLGRLDSQIKIRGFRVELGEIEAHALALASVSRAVAVVHELRPGDARLTLYVVSAGEFDAARILAHLRHALPDYMIPQWVLPIDSLPLLPNGKLNRAALPIPAEMPARAVSESTGTPLQCQVATVMQAVLGVPIGLHDDFFASGGHSLLAAQLSTRLNREFGCRLSLRSVFDAPTVARLAVLVGGQESDAAAVDSTAISRRQDQSRSPFTPAQERLWQLEEFSPGRITYNLPSAHRLTGPLDPAALEQAFLAMIERQPVLRTVIDNSSAEPAQQVLPAVATGLLPVIDLSVLPRKEERETELLRRMTEMSELPFDLTRAPLFRAALFKLEDDCHALFFMPHHIIWDGWSFDLMYAELAELYDATVQRRPADLPPLPVSYGDYVEWHNQWIKGPAYAAQREFWRQQLQGASASGPLRRDREGLAGTSGRGSTIPVSIPAELVARLRRTALDQESTLFMTLLSAYLVALSHAFERDDLVIGTPVRGRNSAEVEHLMGFFTTLLPLRMKLDANVPFSGLLRQVRTVVLDSFANPDIQLEDLDTGPGRRGQRNSSLYHALFSFQDARRRPQRWGALTHERIALFQRGASEDLGLWFLEAEHGLEGGLVYNDEVLFRETATALRQRFLAILEKIAADPALGLAALSDAEQLADSSETVPASAVEQPDQADQVDQDDTEMPGEPIDARAQLLIDGFRELLGVQDITLDDNFFDLGGSSLLALRLLKRIQQATGVRLTLIKLAVGTVGSLASELPAATLESARPSPHRLPGRWLKRLLRGLT